ncbi:MAG TPA: phosphoglucomutase/phosphomannomutase family protein [Thermodesulfobacteriota bacterium]
MGARPAISFGTDGWRGVISRDFTFESVRMVVQGAMDAFPAPQLAAGVLVGYDRRFLSDRYAAEAAAVVAGNGHVCRLAAGYLPTPVVAHAVKASGAGVGIVVTASHNPPEWNGLKFKEPFGGSAAPETTARIERAVASRVDPPAFLDLAEARRLKRVTAFDPWPDYEAALWRQVDAEAIRGARAALGRPLRVVVDPMHGAAAAHLARLLSQAGADVVEIRGEWNPGFGGVNPEPVPKNLEALVEAVRREGALLGLACDGDADRIGAVDSTGRFVSSHQILALFLDDLAGRQGRRGRVVKTVSTTRMVERLAAAYGCPLTETPIGFKYVCAEMLRGDVLIGGEESGGIGLPAHLPERDGLLGGLLLAAIVARAGRPLEAVVGDLERRVGPHAYDRIDLEIAPEARHEVKARLERATVPHLDGLPVVERHARDGYKFILEDGAWLLVRPSGTEPVLRIYAEAATPARVAALLTAGRSLAGV